MGNIKLEGTPSEHDVIIGSNVNLTCQAVLTKSTTCSTIWYKNSKFLHEKRGNARLKWLLGKRISVDRCSVSKLMIKNFTSRDAGKYKCLAVDDVVRSGQTNTEHTSIEIYAGKFL
jgi:orotate phosphoribosyltransferase-like protein